MTTASCNCIVCAQEFVDESSHNTLSAINLTNFKICQSCLNLCDPTDDYHQARSIIKNYLSFNETRQYFKQAKKILNSIKKS